MRRGAMDKRLAKRHKRQVTRARERVKLSEPDLRTPEQIQAAREASRPASGRGDGRLAGNLTPAVRERPAAAMGKAAKRDVGD